MEEEGEDTHVNGAEAAHVNHTMSETTFESPSSDEFGGFAGFA